MSPVNWLQERIEIGRERRGGVGREECEEKSNGGCGEGEEGEEEIGGERA